MKFPDEKEKKIEIRIIFAYCWRYISILSSRCKDSKKSRALCFSWC